MVKRLDYQAAMHGHVRFFVAKRRKRFFQVVQIFCVCIAFCGLHFFMFSVGMRRERFNETALHFCVYIAFCWGIFICVSFNNVPRVVH